MIVLCSGHSLDRLSGSSGLLKGVSRGLPSTLRPHSMSVIRYPFMIDSAKWALRRRPGTNPA